MHGRKKIFQEKKGERKEEVEKREVEKNVAAEWIKKRLWREEEINEKGRQ